MSWLPRQWIVGGLLAAVSIAGLFLARAAAGDTGYWGGLLLFALCVLGVFAAIADAYDPLPVERINSMPDNGALRYIVGGLVGAVGVFGLLRSSGAAASASGGFAYYVGLSLFAVAVAYDFLLIKDWFDRNRTAAPDSPPAPSGGSLRRGPASAADR
jgi:hypothetical protein